MELVDHQLSAALGPAEAQQALHLSAVRLPRSSAPFGCTPAVQIP